MQDLDILVKSLENNIRISLEKLNKLQKLNFELESILNKNIKTN